MRYLLFFYPLVLSFLVSCNSDHDYVFNHDNAYVMSLPSKSNQEHFLKKGGVVSLEVVPNQGHSKVDKISGLKNREVSWEKEGNLSKENIQKVISAFNEAKGAPVLLHSSNPQIAAKTLAYYLHKSGKKSVDEALDIAVEAGLPKEERDSFKKQLQK